MWAGAQPTKISARLPRKVPLDWFNPTIFNKYPAILRARYRDSGVALPAARHWVNGRVPDKFKSMSNTEFKPYSDEVRGYYKLPTDEELAQMDLDGDADEEYDENGQKMDVDDEDEPATSDE
jgi:hypothetical protein